MDFKGKTVYQIYPKSFCDTNGDGWGDLPGIISKLDYLKKLGIDYIWLNAFFPSPQRDNGYDVQDYRSIDPRYGTMDDFLRLCSQAKARGIDIMLDMVFNHTSTEHIWFKKALAGDLKYKNYYIWKKGKADHQPPNNWQSKFGGSAWEYEAKYDEWYLHLFDVTQADLNWENPDVRNEMADIIRYWSEKGVHGFRFDVVNLISKGSYEDDSHHFDGRQFYTDGPHVHEYLQELNKKSFGRDPQHLTVGEMSSTSIENCTEYAGHASNELDMVFSFHHLKVDYKDQKKWELMPFDFMELKKILNEWQIGMQEKDAWNALFLNNHDQPRALSRFGDDQKYPKESAKMLATLIHMMRGTPYVYQGEEIGMTNAYFSSIDQYKDVESRNIYHILLSQGRSKEEILHILQERSRDNSRTPMPWNDQKNGGFTSGTPWLSLADNYEEINVKKVLKDPDSVFAHYQKLIALRKRMKIIQDGIYVPLLAENQSVFAYERRLGRESLIVINNFYGKITEIEIPHLHQYQILLSNYKDSRAEDELPLRPYESIVFYAESIVE
jgi:trehalose-6-phosphate hydrolase